MLRRESEGRRPTPVVAYDEEVVPAENVMRQPPDVLGEGLLIVADHGAGRIAQAAQVWSDYEIVLGESGDDVTPHVPGLRPAVQQQYRRSSACGDVVESHVTQIGKIMFELFWH